MSASSPCCAAYPRDPRGDPACKLPPWVEWLGDATVARLNPGAASWVFHGDPRGKRALLAEYRKIKQETGREKWGSFAALSRWVRCHVEHYHGKNRDIVVYRRMRPGDSPERMAGMSVSTEHPGYVAADAFAVKSSDFLLHHAVPDTALNSRAFGHEQEAILRPGARARYLGRVPTGAPRE